MKHIGALLIIMAGLAIPVSASSIITGGYYYMLEQIDFNGASTRTEPVYLEITVTGIDDLLPVSALDGLVPVRIYNLQGSPAAGRGIGIIITQDEKGNLVKRLRLK